MTEFLPTPRQIEQWRPKRLCDFVGCAKLKAALANVIRCDGKGPNIFTTGDTGTGKTSMIITAVTTLACPKRTDPQDGPCGICPECQAFEFTNAHCGLFAMLQSDVIEGRARPLHFYHVNCAETSEQRLRELVQDLNEYSGHSVVYLDESHRLSRGGLDEALLKPMQEQRATWIASSAMVKQLNPMFLRRFSVRVSTSRPSVEELVTLLARLCKEWQIAVDEPSTLVLLAKCSQRVMGECQNVLACAAATVSRRLSRDLIEDYSFVSSSQS